MKLPVLIFIAACSLLFSQVTVYVDAAGGSDANAGTEATPVQTIQAALDLSPTIVKLKPGVYYDHVLICEAVGYITIESADLSVENRAVWIVDSTLGPNTELGCLGSVRTTKFAISDYGTQSLVLTIRYINFAATRNTIGVLEMIGQPNLTIDGCMFTADSGSVSDMICLTNIKSCPAFDNLTISNNIFFNISGACITFATDTPDPAVDYGGDPHENWRIINNAFLDCTPSSSLVRINETNTLCSDETGMECIPGEPRRTLHISDLHVANNIFSNITTGSCFLHVFQSTDSGYVPDAILDSAFPFVSTNNYYYNVNQKIGGTVEEQEKWRDENEVAGLDPEWAVLYDSNTAQFSLGEMGAEARTLLAEQAVNDWTVPWGYTKVFLQTIEPGSENRISIAHHDFNGFCRYGWYFTMEGFDIGPFEFNAGTACPSKVEMLNTLQEHDLMLYNTPNPFNPSTIINYHIREQAAKADVVLSVYSPQGALVREFNLNNEKTGQVMWDGKDRLGQDVPSGIYLYEIVRGDFRKTAKMILAR